MTALISFGGESFHELDCIRFQERGYDISTSYSQYVTRYLLHTYKLLEQLQWRVVGGRLFLKDEYQYVALDWKCGTLRFTPHNVSSLLDSFRTHIAWYNCKRPEWSVTIK